MTVLNFDRDAHRREKARQLERDNEYLRGERDRLQALLADALEVAAGRDCQPLALLEVLAERRGVNLGLAASRDEPAEQCVDELAQLLRETAP